MFSVGQASNSGQGTPERGNRKTSIPKEFKDILKNAESQTSSDEGDMIVDRLRHQNRFSPGTTPLRDYDLESPLSSNPTYNITNEPNFIFDNANISIEDNENHRFSSLLPDRTEDTIDVLPNRKHFR